MELRVGDTQQRKIFFSAQNKRDIEQIRKIKIEEMSKWAKKFAANNLA